MDAESFFNAALLTASHSRCFYFVIYFTLGYGGCIIWLGHAVHCNNGFISNNRYLVFLPALPYHSNQYFAGGNMAFNYSPPFAEGRRLVTWILQQEGLALSASATVRCQQRFWQTDPKLAFCSYLQLLKITRHLYPGRRFLKAPLDSNT